MRSVTVARVVILATIMTAMNRSSAAAPEQTTMTTKAAMSSVDYLIGNWRCTDTVGDFSGNYTTSYTKVLGDAWLKQTYQFPPRQVRDKSESAVTTEALMGYIEKRQVWIRFFANAWGNRSPSACKIARDLLRAYFNNLNNKSRRGSASLVIQHFYL